MTSKIRELAYLIIIVLLVAVCSQLYYTKKIEPTNDLKVFYNQEKKLDEEIIKVIDASQEYAFFAIYTFTQANIKDALIRAKERGVNVIGVTDKDQIISIKAQRELTIALREAGIPIYVNENKYIMHLKVVVTDKGYASGSYNWTANATKNNDEVLEVGTDPAIRDKYQEIVQKVIMKYQDNLFPIKQ